MNFKFHIIAFIGLLTSVFSISCSLKGNPPGRTEIVQMRVNHYQITGFGVGPQLVYLVQEEDDIGGEDWTYQYDGIIGFDYEPGYIYNLRVRKIILDNPPMDASAIQYVLVKTRSKEKVPDTEVFDVRIKWADTNFITIRDNVVYLNDLYEIDCGEMCTSLQEDLETKDEVTATFSHGEDGLLILHSVR
ncbi:DUF4377 domain-containing protein [Gramella sp. BOM4]|nr:DUF4377 domain-containing protein [Christiangramia bathymodioli]